MNDVPLEGDITVPGLVAEDEEEFSTLDEPVRDTVMRDLKAVGIKFFHVMYPKESKSLLKESDSLSLCENCEGHRNFLFPTTYAHILPFSGDLWGPLVLCVFLAMMLQGNTERANSMNDGGPQFAEVFVIYWVGALIVTLNIKLLGGSISFFQSICVLGYCVLPLTIALVVCRILLLAPPNMALFVVRFVVVIAAFAWSTFASTAFLSECQPAHRKALAVYPIFLFYFIISWLIISHTH